MKITAALPVLLLLTASQVCAVTPAAATNDTAPSLLAPMPASVLRGSQVTLSGDNLSATNEQLCAYIDDRFTMPYPTLVAESSGKSIKFAVPLELEPGIYRVRVIDGCGQKSPLFATAPLEVKSVTPTIAALSETTLYPKHRKSHRHAA